MPERDRHSKSSETKVERKPKKPRVRRFKKIPPAMGKYFLVSQRVDLEVDKFHAKGELEILAVAVSNSGETLAHFFGSPSEGNVQLILTPKDNIGFSSSHTEDLTAPEGYIPITYEQYQEYWRLVIERLDRQIDKIRKTIDDLDDAIGRSDKVVCLMSPSGRIKVDSEPKGSLSFTANKIS